MYDTETEYTIGEEKKLKFVVFRRQLLYVMIVLLFGVLAFTWIGINEQNYFYYLMLGAIGLICMIPIAISYYIRIMIIKKKYSSNDSIIKKYTFLDDHFEETCGKEKKYINYHDTWRLIETKTTLYIMISKYDGFIIKKENCSDELLEFIRKNN